jgi:hypothetical protein
MRRMAEICGIEDGTVLASKQVTSQRYLFPSATEEALAVLGEIRWLGWSALFGYLQLSHTQM